MNYNYGQNIVEIKHEYTTFLTNILTPFIYEGIKSVYTFALGIHKEYVERGKYDSEIKSPGVLKIFQLSLKEIPILNNNSIEIEANRIKSGSKCASWFDSLVRATFMSYIKVLTFTHPGKRAEILKENHHEKIEIRDFIHKCYIESAMMIYNYPELFSHEYPTLEIKRNQRETFKLIKKSIKMAIKKLLPMEMILKEYLDGEYLDDDMNEQLNESKYTNIKNLVDRDMYGKQNQNADGSRPDYSSTTRGSRSSGSGSSSEVDDSSSEGSESGSSNSYSSRSNHGHTTDDHQNTNIFLKEIESQLHVIDNTMNTVKNVKQMPTQPDIPKNENKNNNDKNLVNLFEKIQRTSENNNVQKHSSEHKQSEKKSDVKDVNKIIENNIDVPKNIPALPNPLEMELQNGGKLKEYDPNEFNKPKKLKKNERLLLDEIELQINNKLQ